MDVRIEPHNVLSARIRIELATPARIGIVARAADHTVRGPSATRAGDRHEFTLVGLRPDTGYEVSAYVVDGPSTPVAGPVSVRSGALPDDFPVFRAHTDGRRTSPGWTLLNLQPWQVPTGEPGQHPRPVDPRTWPMLGYLVAVDGQGHVVWYYRAPLPIGDARQLPGGDLLIGYDEGIVRRIDARGRTVREWATRVAREVRPVDDLGRQRAAADAVPVATDCAHHEVQMLSNGNLLLLSTELREFVPDGTGPCPGVDRYEVIGDVVVEVDAGTGRVVAGWSVFDLADPLRRPGDHLADGGRRASAPVVFYPWARYPRDWSHANAVAVDEARNALVISLRHLDAIVAVRFRDDDRGRAGELLWELGADGDVAIDAGEWPSHQHAVSVRRDGSILLYDNGNTPLDRGRDGVDMLRGSRAVVFGFDAAGSGRRVRQCWEYPVMDGDTPLFCRRAGDADELDNGNILITNGFLLDPAGRASARILEVVPDGERGGEVVFDLTVSAEDTGWFVYRSARIAPLTAEPRSAEPGE